MRYTQAWLTGTLLVLPVFVAGCPSQETGPAPLERAKTSLDDKNYSAAETAADEQITATTNTSASLAQAYYMKGRAIESRGPKPNQQAMVSDLAQARSLYEQAIAQKPDEPQLSVIRAALANVAFFQDDYTTAQANWTAAVDNIKDPALVPFIRYRIGVCQQRLGRFDLADKTFEVVQRNYPGTDAAKEAAKIQGARSFTVQVATFVNEEMADKLVKSLRDKKLSPVKLKDGAGRHIVSLPNYQSYDAAKVARGQVMAEYPDALILP